MLWNRRQLLTGAAAGLCVVPVVVRAQDEEAEAPAAGQINEEQLGQIISALGLKPEKQQQRYDFAFAATLDDQKWELSMSSVLSQDGQSIWLMAWLDECPKSAAEVPRTALLRLLAENDKLGSGKFFAYIPANRRFVLQRTIPNVDMTSAKFSVALRDLGTTVVETYPTWSVAGWNAQSGAVESTASANGATPAPGVVGQPAPQGGGAPTKSAVNESKFKDPVKK